MSAKGPYVHSSEVAEVMACRRAIEFSKDVGFSRLIMRALSNPTENRSLLGHIYDDIKCNPEECRFYPSIG